MILGADGTRLSKRHGATSVASFARAGLPARGTRQLPGAARLVVRRHDRAVLARRAGAEVSARAGRIEPGGVQPEKLEWMNGQHLKRLPEDERVRLVDRTPDGARLRPGGHATPEWIATLVRAIGDRLKTLEDAERYGTFALQEPLEIDETAWAVVREKPQVAERLEALAEQVEADREFSLASLERETRSLATAARNQGRRADRHRAGRADRPQGEPRDLRGDVAVGKGTRRPAFAGSRVTLAAGVSARERVTGEGGSAVRPVSAVPDRIVLARIAAPLVAWRAVFAARWCNGSTTGSGPVSRGSNPCRAATPRSLAHRNARNLTVGAAFSRFAGLRRDRWVAHVALSSRGLGQVVLSHQTGVRIPVLSHQTGVRIPVALPTLQRFAAL